MAGSRGADVIVFVIVVSLATILFFYFDNTRSDMDSVILPERCCFSLT